MTAPARFNLRRATKSQLKARVALDGPAGSGKSYTALIMASAFAGDEGTVAAFDTEHGRLRLYSDLFAFDVTDDVTDYHPELLTEWLAYAGSENYTVAVIDSLSHFWMGAGGMLEQVDNATRRANARSSFNSGWKEMRPIERRMVEAMLAFPGHLIVTMRTKTEYVESVDERGKKGFQRVGLKAEQRDGIEYEFDLVGDIDLEHTLVVSKSRCPDLAGAIVRKPGQDFAQRFLSWLNNGEKAPQVSDLLDSIVSPLATVEDLRDIFRQAQQHRLMAAVVLDADGDTRTLREVLEMRGAEVAAVDRARQAEQAAAGAEAGDG